MIEGTNTTHIIFDENFTRIDSFIPGRNQEYYTIERNGKLAIKNNVYDKVDLYNIMMGNTYRSVPMAGCNAIEMVELMNQMEKDTEYLCSDPMERES